MADSSTSNLPERYQYIPLLAFGLMAGMIVSGWSKGLKIGVCIVWIGLLAYRWGPSVDSWAVWRGVAVRNALAHNPSDATFDPSQLSTAQGRRLIEQFHLH